MRKCRIGRLGMKTMLANYQFEEKGFVRSWILFNIIGIAVGVIIAFSIYIGFERYVTLPAAWEIYLTDRAFAEVFPTSAAMVAGILVGNVLIGWGEQNIFKQHAHLSIPWFRATAIGAAVGAGLYCLMYAMPPISYLPYFGYDHLLMATLRPNMVWQVGLSALSIVIAQWLGLRKIFPRSSAWIWTRILSSVCFLLVLIPFAFISILFNFSFR